MADREEGAAVPNQRQGQNQQKIKNQLDSDIYISTGLILSQNSQESQKKMERHTYYIAMIG